MSIKLEPTVKIDLLVKKNPHQEGSKNAALYSKLKAGMTVAEAFDEGLTKSNLLYWHGRKIIKLNGVEVASTPVARNGTSKTETYAVLPRARLRGDPENHVYLFNDPSMLATVLTRGDEQTLVKFPNGNERVVSNDWIKPVKASASEPDEKASRRAKVILSPKAKKKLENAK